jgi:hypothetical protein
MIPSFGFGLGEGTPTVAPPSFGFGFGRDDPGPGAPTFGGGPDMLPSTGGTELPHFGDEESYAVSFPPRKRMNTDSPPLRIDLRNAGGNDGQGSESALDSAPATARLERGDDELSFAGAERTSSAAEEQTNGAEVLLPLTDYGKLHMLAELVDELQARHDAALAELHLERSLRQELQDEVKHLHAELRKRESPRVSRSMMMDPEL